MRPKRRLRTAFSLTVLVALLMVASCFVIVTTTPVRFLLTPWTPEPTLSPLETQTPFLLLTMTSPLSIDTQADLERFLKTSLPTNVTGLEMVDYNIAMQEAALNVRFEASAASIEPFLSKVGFALPLNEGEYPFHENDVDIIEYFNWWKPETAKVFYGGLVSKNAQEYWKVLVDQTNTDRYVVYLMMVLM